MRVRVVEQACSNVLHDPPRRVVQRGKVVMLRGERQLLWELPIRQVRHEERASLESG